MKASIRDETTLGTIAPVDAAAYLRTHGWREVDRKDLRYAIWVNRFGAEDFEILLPLDRSFRDYALRVSELLSTLELVEERSQLEILRDISTTFADVIRIRAPARRMAEGAIQSCIRIPREVSPVLLEAGRVFKQVAALEEITLHGFVTDLHREGSREGTITVSAVVEDRFRKVRVALEPADYDLAISAHRERLPVLCEGDLVREGKGYALRNMRSFGIQREED